jgi:hypothetical protein
MSTEHQIKTKAGYVQVEGFADAHQGYFCGTCRALAYEGDKSGFCTGLQVPVKTYGCCNNWKIASDDKVRGANGVRLKVLR